jgi:glycosyltransferase involved in cell wall biosynthesis
MANALYNKDVVHDHFQDFGTMNKSIPFDRPKLFCLIGSYLPGYKAGGPIRTLTNMVSHLSDEFEFLIVTRDRDISDTGPYHNILIDQWNCVGQASVFYASPEMFSFFGMMRLLRDTPHDLLYINSFFSPVTAIMPLIIRRIGLYGNKPVIIAPRGEFSAGALRLKKTKKKLFLAIANFTGIYRKLVWQASSNFESEDIRRTMFYKMVAPDIIVAPNLIPLPQQGVEEGASLHQVIRTPGPLRIVFLSRISPKKNLDYLLRALNKVTVAVELSIYGPTEDSAYWSQCQSLIQTLPSHIAVTYRGEVTHEKVAKTFTAHDLFVFPTRGENFGHVIYESLAVGTSVIISDQTPWQADPDGAVEVLALEEPDVWTAVINRRAGFNDQAYAVQRTAAVRYANTYLATSPAIEQNRSLFFSALGKTARQNAEKQNRITKRDV